MAQPKSDHKSIKKWRKELNPFYKGLGSMYCKAIRCNVIFNSYGWQHLIRHSNGRRRNVKDAKLRLGLMRNVPEVIKRCSVVRKITIREQNMSGVSVPVTYFELAYTFSFGKSTRKRKTCIVVVLRKIGEENTHFWTTRYDKKQKRP